jgi:hypothetical protein
MPLLTDIIIEIRTKIIFFQTKFWKMLFGVVPPSRSFPHLYHRNFSVINFRVSVLVCIEYE